MACWWSSFIFFVSCCRIWGNNTLQQCLLKSFAFGCWLENNRLYFLSSLMYRSSFCESLGQLTVVSIDCTTTNWCLCWIFSLAKWCLTTLLAAFSYFHALHTSLAFIQGFSLIVTTYNSTALKANGMAGDIFICSSFGSKKFLHSVTVHKKAYVYAHNFSRHNFFLFFLVVWYAQIPPPWWVTRNNY